MIAPTEQTLLEKLELWLHRDVKAGKWVVAPEAVAIISEFEQRLADAATEINRLQGVCHEDINKYSELWQQNKSLSEQLASAHQAIRDQIEVAQRFSDELERVRSLLSCIAIAETLKIAQDYALRGIAAPLPEKKG
jgi:hypothetical protein